MNEPPNIAAELESLGFGVPGPSKIKQALSKTRKINTLINAIEKFQKENEIQMDQLRPALQLLDLHKIPRLEFHELAVNELTEKIKGRIGFLGDNPSEENTKKLEALLDKYLEIIKNDPLLYEDCAVSVKQQIWPGSPELFVSAVQPVIDDYLRKKHALICAVEQSRTNFFTFETTKARRTWPQLHEIVRMIGKREDIYDMFLNLIRKQYTDSQDVHLCSLRMEVLMLAHDNNAEKLMKADKCHDFAWCLDACVRDKHLETQQAAKLKNILDTIKETDIDHVVDMAMISNDVHVVHFLSTTLLKKLKDNAGAHLPREMPSVQLIIRILALGTNVKIICKTREIPTEMVDSIVFTKFLSSFAYMIVEDNIRSELLRLDTVETEDFHMEKLIQGPSSTVQTFLRNHAVAALLWFHYCLEMLPSKTKTGDVKGFMRYAGYLPNLYGKIASHGVWCHLLIHRLIYSHQFDPILSIDVRFHQLMLDEVLLGNIEMDEVVKYQLLRLVNQLGFIWGVPKCLEMLEQISPESAMVHYHSDLDQTLYRREFLTLCNKIDPNKAAEVKKMALRSKKFVRVAAKNRPQMSNPNLEPMPFRRQFGKGSVGSDPITATKFGGAGRSLSDLPASTPAPTYDPDAFVDASGAAIVKQVVTGACRKCGYPGHMTYQCRNFIQLKPDTSTKAYELSSTSSEESEDDETPLVIRRRQKEEEEEEKTQRIDVFILVVVVGF
ncbi:unnamed protein product [Caenorhabditis auriculariae]|uniref:CCHC-type domain-containing protein n=1 Tax=Caenorhabditis auriculariae TaxID=2777116 RepID=A0A8S1H2S2_9PELO|nr:unnamed protein product [Caenorhabditis auriculariae]